MSQPITKLNQPLPTIEQPQGDFGRLLAQPHRASIETYVNASPEPVKAIEAFGKWIAKCGMFGCQREEQGMIIAIACIEMGIGLVEFGNTFDIMHNGKLRKKALAAQVQFEDLGGKVRWLDIGDSGTEKAEVELEFNGNKRAFKFTLDDARAAKIVKKDGAWETWQSEMLCARALSRGIARMCPRVYAGFEIDDESVPQLILVASTPATPANSVSRECAGDANKPKEQVSVGPAPSTSSAVSTEGQPRPADTSNPDEKAEAAAGLAPDPNGYRISEDMAKQLEAALANYIPASVDYMIKLGWISKEQAASGEAFRYVPEPKARDILSGQKRLDTFVKFATKK